MVQNPKRLFHSSNLRTHLLALIAVFAISTFMAIVYATFYYEARAHSNTRNRIEIERRLEEVSEKLEKAESGAPAWVKEDALKERDRLIEYRNNLCNTWIHYLPMGLIMWWPWIILTPGLVFLCRRFPFSRRSTSRAIVVHLLIGLVIGTVKTMAETKMLVHFLNWDIALLGLGRIFDEAITYWVFVAAYNGLAYYRRYREREIRTSQLEAQLAQAQLQMLKIQLHPHFLFNTLHAISTLIYSDIKAADRMICRLSDLLRLSLKNIELQEVPLREELDFLACYLDIEKTRFGDRLVVEREIDPDVLQACVPNLILQPIVENAVNHGISRIAQTGRIGLRASKDGDMLLLEVSDNGPGLPSEDDSGIFRVGLANSRARLRRLYGPGGGIEFISPGDRGLTVRLKIPYHVEPVTPSKGG